ncbi:MAG TPA: hypothetical protein VHD60_03665 [Candidatus Saccharimonadales bacterium]|nr:hypothetical protein [Candidatus Saccharimonadales bacterium]
MSIKTQIKKLEQYEVKHRSGMERLCTIVLAAATIFATIDVSREAARQLKDAFVQPAFAINSAAENEVVRMPVKFDEGVRATSVTGL